MIYTLKGIFATKRKTLYPFGDITLPSSGSNKRIEKPACNTIIRRSILFMSVLLTVPAVNCHEDLNAMMTRNSEQNRKQIQFFSIEDMVPKDHILRLIDEAISFDFIYDLVKNKYSPDFGRPSLDPVMLIKMQLILCLFGIRSMRQTIKNIEVNMAYWWFLGLGLADPVPHFTTFGKNYTRRFKDTDLYEQMFGKVLEECVRCGFVDDSAVFIDSTHIKAAADNHKCIKKKVEKTARLGK